MIGAMSPIGAQVAQRVGARLPITAGLLLLSAGLAVTGSAQPDSRYGLFLVASVMMGAGMGLAMAPATESILDAVPAAKAGVGSAMNEATRELGGVLGVAIVGSVVASAYTSALADTAPGIPAEMGRRGRRVDRRG